MTNQKAQPPSTPDSQNPSGFFSPPDTKKAMLPDPTQEAVIVQARDKQDPKYVALAQNPTVFIFADPAVRDALEILHPHLAGKKLRIEKSESPAEIIEYPQIFKDVTLYHLQLFRNHRLNSTGMEDFGIAGDLPISILHTIRDLISRCQLTGRAWATHIGGYPQSSTRTELGSPEIDFLIDQPALQYQTPSNTGRLHHIRRDETEIKNPTKESKESGKKFDSMRQGALDEFLLKQLLPADEQPISFSEAMKKYEEQERNLAVQSENKKIQDPHYLSGGRYQPIKDGKDTIIEIVDTEPYIQHIANMVVAGAINTSSMAILNDEQNINYKIGALGMGLFLEPYQQFYNRKDIPLRWMQLYSIYPTAYYTGILRGLKELQPHKENITPIASISFPYLEDFWKSWLEKIRERIAYSTLEKALLNKKITAIDEQNTKVFQQFKTESEKLASELQKQVSYKKEDILKRPESKETKSHSNRIATFGFTDAFAQNGNEMRYCSVDAMLGENHIGKLNHLCSNMNKWLQSLGIYLDYKNPAQIKQFQEAIKVYGEAVRKARVGFCLAYSKRQQLEKIERWLTLPLFLILADITAVLPSTMNFLDFHLIPLEQTAASLITATVGAAALLALFIILWKRWEISKKFSNINHPDKTSWPEWLQNQTLMKDLNIDPYYRKEITRAQTDLRKQLPKPADSKKNTTEEERTAATKKMDEAVLASYQHQITMKIAEYKQALIEAGVTDKAKPEDKERLSQRQSTIENTRESLKRSLSYLITEEQRQQTQPGMHVIDYVKQCNENDTSQKIIAEREKRFSGIEDEIRPEVEKEVSDRLRISNNSSHKSSEKIEGPSSLTDNSLRQRTTPPATQNLTLQTYLGAL